MNVNVHSDFFPLHSHYFSYLSLFLLLKTCSRSGLKHDSLSRSAKYLRTFFSRDIRETRRLVIVYVSSNSKGRYTPPPHGVASRTWPPITSSAILMIK